MNDARRDLLPGPVAVVFAVLAMFFFSGSLTTPLTPKGADSSTSVQIIGASIGFLSIVLLLFRPGAIARITGRYYLFLVPVGIAALSIVWSYVPELSIKRVGALGLTTAFGFWLALRFSSRDLLAVIAWGAFFLIVANFAQIIIDPVAGIHQSTVIGGFEPDGHEGKWRGLFGHKNDFGRAISLAACLCAVGVLARIGGYRGAAILLGGLVLSVVMIARAQSSQSVILIAIVPVTLWMVWSMRRMSPQLRALILTIMIPTFALVAITAQSIFVWTLGLLGRDATLTGRTEIWEGTFYAMRGSELLGNGYGAGWELVGERLMSQTGISVGHAHNGYLDLIVDVGWVGLAATLAALLSLGIRSFGAIMTDQGREAGLLGIMLFVFTVVGNWAGSFLLLYNSLFWALPIAAFVKLVDLGFARARARRTDVRHGAQGVSA